MKYHRVGEIASTMERAKQDVPIRFSKQIYWIGCTQNNLISVKHKEVHTYLFLLGETWTSQTKFKGYTCNNRFIKILKFNSQSKSLNKYLYLRIITKINIYLIEKLGQVGHTSRRFCKKLSEQNEIREKEKSSNVKSILCIKLKLNQGFFWEDI